MIKLTWVDVDMATEPGRYDSRYGLIEVTSDDLWVWQKYPNAAFVVMQPSPFLDETICRLGTFELREDWDVTGHEKGIVADPNEASAGNEVVDERKGEQANRVSPPKPNANGLVRLDRDDTVTAATGAESAEETKIGSLTSVGQSDDLQSRIEALIKGL